MYFDAQSATPLLDHVDKWVRVVGYPALLATAIWLVRKWDGGKALIQAIGDDAKTAATKASEACTEVAVIKSNHFAHLQTSMETLALQGTEQIKLLGSMDKTLAVMGTKLDRPVIVVKSDGSQS
jgi:hypothetical protein